VADSIDVRLLGFAGFQASERFMHGLAEEIWVARWDRSQISVDWTAPVILEALIPGRMQ
jgi:hypothetical protein